MRRPIELLSPAGDLERLKIGLLYGADAVYFGGQEYSLRANAANFSLDDIKEACLFAHSLGKRVYLTLNIVFHNEDLDGVFDYIKAVAEAGIDAFIVSDPFIIQHIKMNYPNVEIHLSTQNSTTNSEAVRFFQEQGVNRVVLARELNKNQIKEIIDKTGMDVEIFLHGAMCTCYSGRCTLSNYVTNRDANRGGCAQICRFVFKDEEGNDFTFATKDLNLCHHIKDLVDIGITSLKVEGRMRSLYYLATVIGTYRGLIDKCLENNLTEEDQEKADRILSRVANRESCSHYFEKVADETSQYYTGRQEISNQDFLGIVTGYDAKTKRLILTERNYFQKGDEVEIFTPSGEVYPLIITSIYDEFDQELDAARHPEEILKLDFDKEIEPYAMIRLMERSEVVC